MLGRRMIAAWASLAALALPMPLAARQSASRQIEEVSAADLLARLRTGAVTSEALVRAYRERIAHIDRAGPKLRTVIALNPDALAQAKVLDAERRAGKLRGPLHGLPILVKDNIETADPMPTTAGSLALKDNVTGRDAPVIARLRAAGVIILGKTNLSEWANFRSTRSISGWSGIGGLTKNPYALDRSAFGAAGGRLGRAEAGLELGARPRVERHGGRDRREPGCGRHRHGDGRIHHLPQFDERPGRPQAHARRHQPHAHRADQPQPGYRRADGPQRAGRGPALLRDDRQ